MRPENIIRSCARYSGLTVGEAMAVAKNAPARYKVYTIPKRNGSGERVICHPARELKALQYYFIQGPLSELPIHHFATAYKQGSSIKENARAHLKGRVILKLDLQSFFNQIKASDWRKFARDHFPDWSGEELAFATSVMFWGEGTAQPRCLAIGAPTSPGLSNAMMFEFDCMVEDFCASRRLIYTRYADDLTFSSEEYLDRDDVIGAVSTFLSAAKYTNHAINPVKTKLFSKAFARRVTGIVLTNDERLSLGRERKRLIRAMMHHALQGSLNEDELKRLRGLLAFAKDVEPTFLNSLAKSYGLHAVDGLLQLKL